MAARAKKSQTVRRGRRSDVERALGKWRLTIREITERRNGYAWQTYLVQGFKDERGKWARRKFKDKAEAEAFVAMKQLEHETRGGAPRPILTRLSVEQVRQAELAVEIITAGCAGDTGAPPTLTEAAEVFVKHWKALHAMEPTDLRTARRAYLSEIERRKSMRPVTLRAVGFRLGTFEKWMREQPRFLPHSLDPDWTPAVHEITHEDVTAHIESRRTRGGLLIGPGGRNNIQAILSVFFDWCRGIFRGKPIPAARRKWCLENPAAHIQRLTLPAVTPQILTVPQAQEMMHHLDTWRKGRCAPYYALALFAGIRPSPGGELHKLSLHPGAWSPTPSAAGRPLIDLERGIITIPPEVAKTGRRRVITIQPNLAAWLTRHQGTPIYPSGAKMWLGQTRKKFSLHQDICRHSFISYFVALTGSKARAALEAGNSESIIDKHYLNLPTEAEGKAFFAIMPPS